MSNLEFHECPQCSHRWRVGHDGSHSCIKNLQRQFRDLKAKTRICMGIGASDGNLFVYGNYESIKAAQATVIRMEELAAEVKKLNSISDAWKSRATAAEKDLDLVK